MSEKATVNGTAAAAAKASTPTPQEQVAALQDMVRSISAQRDAALSGQVQLDMQFAAYRRVAEKKIAELQAQLSNKTVDPVIAKAVEDRVAERGKARKAK